MRPRQGHTGPGDIVLAQRGPTQVSVLESLSWRVKETCEEVMAQGRMERREAWGRYALDCRC
jgi:hypothetical protein